MWGGLGLRFRISGELGCKKRPLSLVPIYFGGNIYLWGQVRGSLIGGGILGVGFGAQLPLNPEVYCGPRLLV